MTTQTSSSENKAGRSPNRRFFNSAYFSFRLRCGWPLFVVFLFIFMLSLIVPGVKYASHVAEGYLKMSAAKIHSNVMEYMSIIGVVNVGMSMLCGFICGLTAMKYVDKKVAVNFYHSLPLRREAHFICSVLPPFVTYLTAFVFAHLVNFAIFAMRYGEANFAILGQSVLYGVIFFMLVYSITLAGASLSGTGFMRFVSTMYIMFMPIAVFLLFIGIIAVGNSQFNADYYFNDRLISLCPPLRALYVYSSDENRLLAYINPMNCKIAMTAVISLVMLIAAFVLYLWRHSESASQPLIWKAAKFVFKYSSMFMGGTLFGLIFRAIFESDGWMLFGVIVGSFITFMLVNGILNKSARAIFKGVRGLIVYACVMAAIVIVFYADAFGMFSGAPQPSFVKTATISIDNYHDVKFGGDFAYRATKLLGQAIEQSEEYYHSDDYVLMGYPGVNVVRVSDDEIMYSDADTDIDADAEPVPDTEPVPDDEVMRVYSNADSRDTIQVSAIYKTKLGFHLAMQYYIDCESAQEFINFVENYTAENGGGYPDSLSEITNIHIYAMDESEIYGSDSTEARMIYDYLKDRKLPENPGIAVGNVELYGVYSDAYLFSGQYNYYRYLLYESDAEFIGKFFDDLDVSATIADVKKSVKNICVVSNTTDEHYIFSDRDEMSEIIDSLYSLDGKDFTVLPCERDHGYNVFLSFSEESSSEMQYYISSSDLSFRRGCVPEFVTRLVGE